METIRNYLETMFANMPNTDAVKKAKQELMQMMEDKYSELIAEGKSENEAVGTVISEFGNLEELSDNLGVKEEYQQEQMNDANNHRRNVSMEEAKSFLKDNRKRAFMVSIGVLLCICCPIGPIVSDELKLFDIVGVGVLMLFIAVAVFLFVFSPMIIEKWNFIKKSPCSIDFNTANYLHKDLNEKNAKLAIQKTIGIVMCVICWFPAAIISEWTDIVHGGMLTKLLEDCIAPVLLFLMIGIGVALIVESSMERGGYRILLRLNDRNTMSGYYVPEQKEEYINEDIADIMSVYWPTITCLYFIWSFLSFDWYITWIIWPIASIVHAIIKNNLKKVD